jgi:hypothetical protein
MNRTLRLSAVAAFAATAILAGCSKDSSTAPLPVASSLREVAGDSQSVALGATVSPLIVRVAAADGSAMSGVRVVWSLLEGAGSLSDSVSTTDANGQASVLFTPSGVGVDSVAAKIDAIASPVDFTITVTDTTSNSGN